MFIPIFVALAISAARDVHADGGMVRLRAEDESLIATLFAPNEVNRDAAIDFTVLVQDRANSEIILDAVVELQVIPPPGGVIAAVDPWCRPPRSTLLAGVPGDTRALPPIVLTRAQADNKLLSGVSVIFPAAGEWRMKMIVRRANSALQKETILTVGDSSSRLGVIWRWLAFPPLTIGLFALNQRLRFRRERAHG